MRLRGFHKKIIINDVTMLVMQLHEKNSYNKKPSLGQADGKLKDSQNFNLQFSIDCAMLSTMKVLGF